ncbi:ABC transporter substrate-binding protein [Halobacillus andaensis]|uniref:ABC transporter substrate-binding protein n=1 Tax=Halobacillus andaensis TaxID=1176239 RepID=UPI003D724107
MLKKAIFRSFLFFIVTSLVFLAACSESGNEEASGSSDGEQIELTFWNIWTEPSPQNEASLKRVEQFMEENPDIKITQQKIPHDQFKVKVKTQAAGKQLPDLVQAFPGAELKPLVNGGLVQPIDDFLDHWDGLIPEGQLGDYRIDGKQYAIPANVTPTSLVYYDKDMLAEVGYDEFPKSYEEFKNLIKDLRGNDVIPISWEIKRNGYCNPHTSVLSETV